jgi:V/A-type H+-transporting ATPase subunit D
VAEERISPTRMALLEKKAQITLAVQGVDLLKNKRDALIKEFFSLVQDVMNVMDQMDAKGKEAVVPLMYAKVFDGEEGIYSAAMAQRRDEKFTIVRKNIWGIKIPEVERRDVIRHATARGYALAGTSARIHSAARKYEEIVALIIEMASTQIRVKRLGDEIRKTTRRVNALEQAIIPQSRRQVRFIRQVLEEREREDLFRLKRLKKITEKKKK